MAQHQRGNPNGMQLYDEANRRLYINSAERTKFIAAAKRFPPLQRTLCLSLVYTGCRISEALSLTPSSVQLDSGLITFRTSKQRGKQLMREVPIPPTLTKQLNHWHEISVDPSAGHALWQRHDKPINRITAYRWAKEVMAEAEITGPQACPKGLRHGFAIHALLRLVPLHMVQKWMGHTSITTTQIYADACGPEEREIAQRMW